jgi:hypothetical protein
MTGPTVSEHLLDEVSRTTSLTASRELLSSASGSEIQLAEAGGEHRKFQ